MSNGIEVPSSCGMSAVTALPPIRSSASYTRKSKRPGCRCSAQAVASPDTPAPTIAMRLGLPACFAPSHALPLPSLSRNQLRGLLRVRLAGASAARRAPPSRSGRLAAKRPVDPVAADGPLPGDYVHIVTDDKQMYSLVRPSAGGSGRTSTLRRSKRWRICCPRLLAMQTCAPATQGQGADHAPFPPEVRPVGSVSVLRMTNDFPTRRGGAVCRIGRGGGRRFLMARMRLKIAAIGAGVAEAGDRPDAPRRGER